MRQNLSLDSPMVNTRGILVPPWVQFFAAFLSAPSAIQPVTVGASPFSYQANDKGMLSIVGGTVSAISIARAETTVGTGQTAGLIPVGLNDIVTITYTVAPTVNFIPS